MDGAMPVNERSLAFDEAFYLAANPDVAAAIANGTYASAFEHFDTHGRSEGRPGVSAAARPSSPRGFDETWYLANNPDVAAAVASGALSSAYAHWTASGRAEGRIAPPGYDEGSVFDEAWYRGAYHFVASEIASGRATDAMHHYQTIGRFRGYLPNPFVARPDNPAGIASRFGGLWLDNANASDLIEGRREIGQITDIQAGLLRHWAQKGYIILRQAIPADLVDRARAELHRAYDGEIEGLRFECPVIGGFAPMAWDPGVRDNPAKALDLHWKSPTIRDLIFAEPVRKILELIFERRAMASQTLTFLNGSTQAYHQDTVYVPFSLPTQFAASWIALEDVSPGGGELTYFPGSQRLPEILYGGQYKTLWDAQRMLRSNALRDEMKDYSQRLADQSRNAGIEPESFMAKKGDVLLWHADLAHGGLPITNPKTRASVVTHYCPKDVAPLTFERGGTAVRSHNDQAWYATGYYAGTTDHVIS